MISMNGSPVGWAMLMYDLDDAKEDLETLMTSMQNDPDFDEDCFRIRLGHIYWHLNCAWLRRNVSEELSDADRASAKRFPDDLEPI
jgi:hypothetical protein